MDNTRRYFIRKTSLATGGIALGVHAMSAKSYGRIIGSNDRVRVGISGFSDRAKGALIPAFNGHGKKQNFEIVGVSDIWNRRRDEGVAYIGELTGNKITQWRNNEEMYSGGRCDGRVDSRRFTVNSKGGSDIRRDRLSFLRGRGALVARSIRFIAPPTGS
jgi:hypothetical protein